MTTAVIVDAVRTAGGKRNGKLRNWHAVDLASEALRAVAERNQLDPALVDDVIMGCVMQVAEQSLNIGRNAVLAAGWPESVPATTIDRQCGSSQQAVHFAAQGVMAGAYDIAIAGGIESMTRTPMGSSVVRDLGFPFGPRMMQRYTETGLPGQGIGAEMIADKWGISREELDAFSVRSHQRAARATAEGRFENEIVPVSVRDDEGHDTDEVFAADEGIRPDSSVETLAKLKPAFKEDGKVTAGNSSQITDGASAVLIMSEEKANALGLRPRARFHAFALAGVDPVTMLTGPIPATTTVLERAKLTMDDIDAVEINEAFASVVLAWEKEHHPNMELVNPNGGAIALGHPLGASGGKLTATLLNELERTNGRYGLLTMCEGGGLANATIIERLG
ncbi:MAG TPA: thiolase family protein [Acidimicrobiales bacterium]|jgi:acetyl-CoA acyltransferase|nr:thiolase family protein [Acidimicrobiales bacterium]